MNELTVIDLRQYTLYPGRRDELIELFDREFVETQEAGGMVVLGQFRDLDAPDRFVWLRGFEDMPARKAALTAFYDGPVWAEHGKQANATMKDSSDTRLLRPLVPGGGFAVDPGRRQPVGATPPLETRVFAHLWSLTETSPDQVVRELDRTVVKPLAVLTTKHADNNFPRLPIRTDDTVIVVFSYDDLSDLLRVRPQRLRLTPTERSLIR